MGEGAAGPEPEQPGEPDPAETPGLAVTLDMQTPDCDPSGVGWLEVQLAWIGGLAGVEGGVVHVLVVADDRMAELHEQYKQVAGTTDVLTFDLRDDPDQPLEGDIVICMDEARRQAGQRGHDTRLELLLYALHGLLHLLGEDDQTPGAFERMHRREDELLTRAGFGPVFRDD